MPEMNWDEKEEVTFGGLTVPLMDVTDESLYEGDTTREWRELFEDCVAAGDFVLPKKHEEEVPLDDVEVKLLASHVGEDMADNWIEWYGYDWSRWALGMCESAASIGQVSHIVLGVRRELAADARRLQSPGRGHIKRVNERFPGPAAKNLLDCWISSDPKVRATAIAMSQMISENPIWYSEDDDDVRARIVCRAAVSWCQVAWLDPKAVDERTQEVMDKTFAAMSAFGGEA